MPYISPDRRNLLDNSINQICSTILDKQEVSNEDFLSISGDINYCFSRIISKLMGKKSYPKIATTTGVLENIKQEFYRRVAQDYEDKKIVENGDIPEYKKEN